MEDNVQKLANAGQPEDSQIIHAAPGEMVVPPVISEQTQQMINQDLQSVGLNPAEYMVGQGSINNLTGLQEFGFLSKLFKKVVSDASTFGEGNTCDIVVGSAIMLLPLGYALNHTFVLRLC